MRILFDANTPAPLKRFLRGHSVELAIDLGWQELKNGKLLNTAEENGFDVLVTCDQNIRHQQNFADRKVGMVVLSTNHWPSMRPVAHRIAAAVDFVQRGQVVFVDISTLQR